MAAGKILVLIGALLTLVSTFFFAFFHVVGDVSGENISLSKTSSVGGTLFAKKGTSFVDTGKKKATEKVKRFETDVDVVDEVTGLLE